MNLINKEVKHRVFGVGNIIDHSDNYISVDFRSGNKEFVFPDVFGKYLTLIDKDAAEKVNEKLKKVKKDREAEEKLEQILNERNLIMARRARRIKNSSYSNRQSVFWIKDGELEEIFSDESLFIGNIKSGKNEGKPRRLVQIDGSSACLLTKRSSDSSEKDRAIVGVFMADKGFSGRDSKDGLIPVHPDYKLTLSEEESKNMLFWNYYVNDKNPKSMVWNSGRHRYFDNEYMAQIINDIVNLKNDDEKDEANKFFEYFLNINNIDKNEITEPSGPLTGK